MLLINKDGRTYARNAYATIYMIMLHSRLMIAAAYSCVLAFPPKSPVKYYIRLVRVECMMELTYFALCKGIKNGSLYLLCEIM